MPPYDSPGSHEIPAAADPRTPFPGGLPWQRIERSSVAMSEPKPIGRPFGLNHQPRGKAWTPGELSALGSAPDHITAAELGRTRSSVIWKRRSLGIPAHQPPGRPSVQSTTRADRACDEGGNLLP